MKNFFNSLLAISLITSSLTYSKPSEAAVGALLVTPAVVVTGLVVAGGGYVFMNANSGGDLGSLGAAIIGVTAICLGVIILDGENTLSFNALTAKEALKLGLTKNELSSFNTEIDQVNAVLEMVSEEIAHLGKVSETESAVVWDSAREHLTPETFSAMVKVAQQMTK